MLQRGWLRWAGAALGLLLVSWIGLVYWHPPLVQMLGGQYTPPGREVLALDLENQGRFPVRLRDVLVDGGAHPATVLAVISHDNEIASSAAGHLEEKPGAEAVPVRGVMVPHTVMGVPRDMYAVRLEWAPPAQAPRRVAIRYWYAGVLPLTLDVPNWWAK